MNRAIRAAKWTALLFLAAICLASAYYAYLMLTFDADKLPENHGRVNVRLYVGEGENQPLLVAFGGAEGGNVWTGDRLQEQRDRFLSQGYAFLAVAYFGEEGIPKEMDRIALEGVYGAIAEASNHPKINRDCIALLGGSKGAELALVLASRYPTIKAVVGIVPGNAVFAANTALMNTSSFSSNGESLPFVPVPWSAVPSLITGDLRGAWDAMLEDENAVAKAAILVEKINGPIFLISATRDEFWPSAEMSEAMVQRLTKHGFRHPVEHVAIDGTHSAPLDHFDLMEESLRRNFLAENANDCPR
ncbi:MAG TPA: acyl-CoA thioester hydrolase/BAAT C-terminal domain-containing protein [Steroidobacteraceae bacterium]|nr:acyl-CoA thioester hydrolase/BAAT C-terminal domain-containing protein [Steroidobacteraceae bacterium]